MGKSTSKLKPENRSQSIAWSFRFPSTTSIHQALGSSRRRFRKKFGRQQRSCKDLRECHDRDEEEQQSTCPPRTKLIVALRAGAEQASRRISLVEDLEDSSSSVRRQQQQHRLRRRSSSHHDDADDDDDEDDDILNAVRTCSLPASRPHDLQDLRHRPPSNGSSSSQDDATPLAEPSEESVLKLLERELRLFDLVDPRDLRSYAWYHGSTLPGGRRGAEAEIPNDGDFLVRDCFSQPGNYVLSVRHRGQALHFVINKVVHQADTVYESVQYSFEDEGFDTVADLITFYVGSKRPITQSSGARIVTPRQRKVPLSSVMHYGPSASSSTSSLSTTTSRSPPRRRKERSQSLTPCQQQHYQSPPPPQLVMQPPAPGSFGSHQSSTLPRMPQQNGSGHPPLSHSLSLGRQRANRDPAIQFQQLQLQYQRHQQLHQQQQQQLQEHEPHYQSPKNNSAVLPPVPGNETYDTPPNKPPRVPRHLKPNAGSYHHHHQASGSDSGNGSGDSEFESSGAGALPIQPAMKGVAIRNYHQAKALGLGDLDIKQWEELEKRIQDATPNYQVPSHFNLEEFRTLLLPNLEHKPLDGSALRGVTTMLFETASRVLASHITKIDVDMLLKKYADEPPSVRDGRCGLELCILPYAHQTRLDIIERTEGLKLLVATTVLTCGSPEERAATISRWIQVAIDVKTALGNLFGFCSIMLGLSLPQIQKLTETWNVLRQNHTQEAFTFEAKLRPTLRAMNECADPQAPNTTLPHILPIALLNERTQDDALGNTPPSALVSAVLMPWVNSAPDGGVSIMWAHLEASRKMTENLALFRRNAEIALEGCRNDELLGDAFRTEFHARFLWGSRGVLVEPAERHAKFVQILDVMYDRCLATE